MLAIRIVGDKTEGDGFPDFCSLCGKPATDYLITPWEHINVCGTCLPQAAEFFAFAHRLEREFGGFAHPRLHRRPGRKDR